MSKRTLKGRVAKRLVGAANCACLRVAIAFEEIKCSDWNISPRFCFFQQWKEEENWNKNATIYFGIGSTKPIIRYSFAFFIKTRFDLPLLKATAKKNKIKLKSINCRGRLLDLSQPKIMGILNVTPDSFYAGSRVQNEQALLKQATKMLDEGASILDVGGASSRPGAATVSIEEECQRVIPVIELLTNAFPTAILSVDTFQAKVAKEALEAGAHIINDISAWSIDNQLVEVVADYQVPYILMHMQGTPQNMQQQPHYEDLLVDIMDFFIQKIRILKDKGLKDIILDVGFGFGKTIAHNYQLLQQMQVFQTLGYPLMTGLSRKSMIWKVLESSPQEALNGTTALHMIALQQGAQILRVHDVKEAAEVIRLWQCLESNLIQ